jgi:putative drug exporter of the RND superfamily
MKLSPESLARSAAEHPWRMVAIWGVALIAGIVIAGTLFGSATTNEQSTTRPAEAERAGDALEAAGLRGPEKFRETVVIEHPSATVDDLAFRDKVTSIATQIRALGPEKVESVASFYDPENPQAAGFASESRKATIILVTMTGDIDTVTQNISDVLNITDSARTGGYVIGVAGQASISQDFQEVSERDLRVGETIGIMAALVILLFVFGAFGSAWIPLAMSVCAIILAVAASALIGQVYPLSFFVINMISMIGLAVGTDYTLFVVARFREERAKGVPKVDAIARAGATATRAVVFSGLTVIFALLGMLLVPTNIFFSLGLGAILVASFAVVLALTFLPAVLSLMGDRVNAWKLPFLPNRPDSGTQEAGFWNWVTKIVLARPAVFLAITAGALIALTIPYFSINKGFNGVETLPDSFESKHAFETLIREFPQVFGANVSSVDIVVQGDAGSEPVRQGTERLAKSLANSAVFGDVQPYAVSGDGKVGLLQVNLKVAADSEAANNGIRALRKELLPGAGIPAAVLVGGNTAFNVDFFNLTDRWQPIVFAIVLSLSFLLLMVVFRSIVVPVKAIILNLLSVGAAYGLLVLVFQMGYGAELLGFAQVDVIEAWIPLFLFSVLFGLSMDYEVFLLSRMRERYDETKNNEESVAFGLRSTASLITGAALIMVAVFAGFALGDLVMFQQFGFGLGVAVLVDATLIRSVLVPSAMKLLGDANWYLPKFLNWLPDLRVEVREPAHGARPGAPVAAPAGGANGKTQKG